MNFILIDGSYFIFYRYHALLTWWRHAKPDESKDSEPTEMPEFMEKFQSTFTSKLLEIPSKLKLKDETNIMMVAKDCPRSTIWRNKYYDKYKATREKTDTIMVKPFFKDSYDSLFQNAGIETILSYPELEADDCIAITVEHITKTYPDAKVWVIASDMDYAQLASERVNIITLKYTNITDSKHLSGNAEKDLFCKIVSGDKSDNIPPIFPRCGAKTAAKYYDKPAEFEKKLAAVAGSRELFERNKCIVSFKHIPEELVQGFRRVCLRLQ